MSETTTPLKKSTIRTGLAVTGAGMAICIGSGMTRGFSVAPSVAQGILQCGQAVTLVGLFVLLLGNRLSSFERLARRLRLHDIPPLEFGAGGNDPAVDPVARSQSYIALLCMGGVVAISVPFVMPRWLWAPALAVVDLAAVVALTFVMARETGYARVFCLGAAIPIVAWQLFAKTVLFSSQFGLGNSYPWRWIEFVFGPTRHAYFLWHIATWIAAFLLGMLCVGVRYLLLRLAPSVEPIGKDQDAG